MTVSAQISLYPLRQQKLGPPIEALRAALERHGLEVHVGPMSTLVTGETSQIFRALQEGFEQVTGEGQVALVVTLSNACPVPAR
jgi:uncharacterized protein YqgV (UPF0045/DUF77 family)